MSGEKEKQFWEKTLSVFDTQYYSPVPSTVQLKSQEKFSGLALTASTTWESAFKGVGEKPTH